MQKGGGGGGVGGFGTPFLAGYSTYQTGLFRRTSVRDS